MAAASNGYDDLLYFCKSCSMQYE